MATQASRFPTIEVSGIKPNDLSRHVLKGSYDVERITVLQFADMKSGQDFDPSIVGDAFANICPDFKEKLEWNKPSQALGAAAHVLFIVGPASREIKKGQSDSYTPLVLTWL